MWTFTFLEQLAQDLRYALRTMAANPLFTATAALSLALGIGANTAIYSFMDAILMRSLPVANADRLAILTWHAPRRPGVMKGANGSMFVYGKTGRESPNFPFAAYQALRDNPTLFSTMFSYTYVAAFAAKHHQGDRTAAVEALIRNGPNVRYVPNNTYADAKLIIAWWVAALARRLPSGMAVYAVSPGGATDTKVVRNAGAALKYLFIPIVNLIPGMNQTPETAARRYLQASVLGTDVSGQFFASKLGKFTGPIEAQLQPHLHDRASQEAAWQAVVQVSGVDSSNPASLGAVS